jgi:outer membrane receptor for ferrienterochelin and colicins
MGILKGVRTWRVLSLMLGSVGLLQGQPAAAPGSGVDTVRQLDEVVVTATRTARRRSESPVLVRVMDRRALQSLPATSLSDALAYQPGLRVEVACQTCNYTQLRMSGLPGAYSQVLVNGRPLFSPLLGLYGLEQLPAELVERVEVVRGGGSSLYGSSAIGGTVNIITRQPDRSGTSLHTQYQPVGGRAGDLVASVRSSHVRPGGKAGLSLLASRRDRQWYDANADGFSEIPRSHMGTVGANLFLAPRTGRRLEASLAYLGEDRRGGEMTDKPAPAAAQAEDRRHGTWTGSVDYRHRMRDGRFEFNAYAGGQQVRRDHYTGILPVDSLALATHLGRPPLGGSLSRTLQAGVQFNLHLRADSLGRHTLTAGAEVLRESVDDSIPAYAFRVRQTTRDVGLFLQSDWSPTPRWSLLTGIRSDIHNLVPGRIIPSPRAALLFRPRPARQLRLGYGAGFRAPQAFDSDLHMAFAGGGVSRILIDPALREERSHSLNLSWNADHADADRILGYTLEAFHTRLEDAFTLENDGRDAFGEVFRKRNGGDAVVSGLTAELRAERRGRLRWEASLTWQRSHYLEPVRVVDGRPPLQAFLRTPDLYGYSTLSLTLRGRWTLGVSQVFTGPMQLAHFAGGSDIPADRIVRSRSFLEHHIRVDRPLPLLRGALRLDLFAGLRNLTNAYQADFDRGPNRDSNYVYGPALPRSLFAGLRCRFD